MPLRRLSILLCALPLWAGAEPGGAHLEPFRGKVSFENVGMPFPGETLGLAGIQVLHDFRNGAYLGIGSYGAVTGKRGGFITAGVSGGYRVPLGDRVTLDAGLHLGGGGAGRAAVGGGLMLRAHAGFDVRAAGLLWGAELAHVRFPNGRIDNTEVALSVTLPFRTWLDGGERREHSSLLPDMGLGEGAVLLHTQRYLPRDGTRLLTGGTTRNPVELIGLTATADLSSWNFFSLELAAAGRGNADGYMEIMLGLGARMDLTPGGEIRGYVRASAGPVGGGNLDVGGGMAYRAGIGLQAQAGELLFGTEVGRLATPSATFDATTYQVSVGRRFRYVRPGGRPLTEDDSVITSPWRLRTGVLHLQAPQRRRGQAPDAVNLVGIQLDSFFTEHVYATGSGLFGTNGHAGGFAMGVVGLGLRTGAFHGLRGFLELQYGAAGGGGVDTGGGAVALPVAGLELDLGQAFCLTLQAGRAVTRKGALDTDALGLSFGYRFGLLERKGR